MAQISSQKSLIIVGGGIVGLCIAVAALSRGHNVTVIAKDAPEGTASGVAAGMIAPAMEAMNDPDPVMSFQRLKAAQTVWLDMFDIWPESVRVALQSPQRVIYEPIGPALVEIATRFTAMGVEFTPKGRGFDLSGDWLVESGVTLEALRTHILSHKGHFVTGDVSALDADSATLVTGEVMMADQLILAAGYDSKRFADVVPSVGKVSPIQGQLLDVDTIGGVAAGVTRSPLGYWANFGRSAKFGASMQAGREDLVIDTEISDQLSAKAEQMAPGFTGLPLPRVGIRASTPDGWPLIGRDSTSGVLVATGMRRNGYVFAPMAARIVLDLMDGQVSPGSEIYSPDRFNAN